MEEILKPALPKIGGYMPVPYNFQYFRYRNESWWRQIKVKAIQEGISVNQLIVKLLDAWLSGRITKVAKE